MSDQERSLSLWAIDEALHDLLLLREQEGLAPEEQEAIDGQIREWVESKLAKVDRVAGYIRHGNMMAEQARKEAQRYDSLATAWENRIRKLKDMCLGLMEKRGVKRLEGNGNVLRVQGNGGKLALKITREDLVPDEYRVATIRMPAREWCGLKNPEVFIQRGAVVTFSTDEAAVRKALESKCKACGGSGSVCPSGPSDAPMNTCGACNGTGHTLVPGAELLERGQHLRVE